MHPPTHPLPPGPSLLRLPGLIGQRRKSALLFYREMTSMYGPLSFCRLGSLKFCFMNDADAVKTVTQDHYAMYTKGSGYQRLKAFVGNGILTSEGDFWRKQRRIAASAFHSEALRIQSEAIREEIREWVGEQQGAIRAAGGSREVDLGTLMADLSLRAGARVLFGADSRARARTIVSAAGEILHVWGEKAVDWLRIIDALLPLGRDAHLSFRLRRMTGGMRDFDRSYAALDRIVRELIEERRKGVTASTGPKADVLGLLVKASDRETTDRMTDSQLRDEVMTFMLAGFETTAASLTWTLYCLDREPELRARIMKECASQSAEATEPSKDSLLSRFIAETLRLYPPIWRYSREAQQDDEVLGFRIPKGTVMVAPVYYLHRNPRYWENPEKFDPDRFLPERSASRHRYAYVPFGSGPRSCIGMGMALLEMEIAIAEILRNFRIQMKNPGPVIPEAGLTLRPKDGIRVVIGAFQ